MAENVDLSAKNILHFGAHRANVCMNTRSETDSAFRNEGYSSRRESRSTNTGLTLESLIEIYLEDYELRQFSTLDTARGRVAYLAKIMGKQRPATDIVPSLIRQYQMSRRRQGAAAATVNRETSALSALVAR